MGIVFRASRVEDGREVALKVLKVGLADDLLFQHRFRQEARAAAEVREPHLVPIIEAAEADGRHYLAVDYVAGGSSPTASRLEGPSPPPSSSRLVSEVAAGMDALHDAGIDPPGHQAAEHPLRGDGTAMLTDFGLARGAPTPS